MSGSKITVEWGPVDCIHRNGGITNYSVQYEALGSGETQTTVAFGELSSLTNLMSSTTYSIKVAAVNSAGTGEFSPVIMTATLPSEYMNILD